MLRFLDLLGFLDFFTPDFLDLMLPDLMLLDRMLLDRMPRLTLVFLDLVLDFVLDHVRNGFHCLHPPCNDFVDA